MSKNPSIILISGNPCVGKTTFANELHVAKYAEVIVDVGAIVRRITSTTERVHSASLDSVLIHELTDIINNAGSTNMRVAIVGIRQSTIVKALVDLYGLESFELYWLSATREQLVSRFNNRKDPKDVNLTYQQVLDRDNALGLADLKEYFLQLQTEQYIIKAKSLKHAANTL